MKKVNFEIMTPRECCIRSAMEQGRRSRKDAQRICADEDNTEKKRYEVSSYGFIEASGEPEPLDQTTTIRCVGRGVEFERMFIEEQMKRGVSKAQAEKLAVGIKYWLESKAVKDADGNISSAETFYFTHSPTGEKEFHPIEQPKPKELTALDLAVESCSVFKDTKHDPKGIAEWILYADPKWVPNVTPKTLQLRRAFNQKQSFMQTRSLMTDWIMERRDINAAEIERKRKKKRSGSRLTASNPSLSPLYKNPKLDNYECEKTDHLIRKGEHGFPLHNRPTIGKYKEQGGK